MYEVHQHINPETQTTTTTRAVKRSGQVSAGLPGLDQATNPKQRTDDDDDDDDDDSNPINHFGKSKNNQRTQNQL